MSKAPHNKDAVLIPGNSCLGLPEGSKGSGLDLAPLRDKKQTREKGKIISCVAKDCGRRTLTRIPSLII